MTSEKSLYCNNPENLNLEYPKYALLDNYRQILNENSGMDLVGIGDDETYDRVLNSKDTIFKTIETTEGEVSLPIAATNDVLEFFDPQYIPRNAVMIISPKTLLSDQDVDELKREHTLLLPEQKLLSQDLVDRYLTKIRDVSNDELEHELAQDIEGELMPKTGFAVFMGITKYDVSDCEDLKNTPLPEETIAGDTVSTTSIEQIKSKLPALIELYEEIFSAQTEELGFYDGLDTETMIKIIESGDFTPVATFNKSTGEALAFAIFARNISDLHNLGWLNGVSTKKVIDALCQTKNPILSIPLTVVSKGGGNFPLITKIAAHAALEGTKARELFTITETNTVSINYTPVIINKTLQKLGFKHQESLMEATFLTKI